MLPFGSDFILRLQRQTSEIQVQVNVFVVFGYLLLFLADKLSVKSNTDARIVGGQAIYIDSAPWQVSVRLMALEEKMYGLGHICGGAVISERVVITAAHCTLK